MGVRAGAVEGLVQLNRPPPRCRLCRAALPTTLIDLGDMPLANALPTPAQAARGADPVYPLHVRLCHDCGLAQADDAVPPAEIFADYPYFSSVSASWVAHAAAFAGAVAARMALGRGATVLEIASNDGYLLQHFQARGIGVLGIEPAANVARVAVARGIPTRIAFFDRACAAALAGEGLRAELVVANNVLAHVPDPGGFVAGIAAVLAPEGLVSIEFPHLLCLLAGVQFDTIYHEHLSYLSLGVVERMLSAAGLRACAVERLPTHGGSLRVFACHQAAHWPDGPGLAEVRDAEAAGLAAAAAGFAARAAAVRCGLRRFLDAAAGAGRRVAAYGAAAKGATLLNACGVSAADIACVADAGTAKQGRLLPGCRVPIVAPARLRQARPDDILILPWNLADEIAADLADVAAAGTRLWVAVPALRRISRGR